jgi:hypothetical protein
MKIRSYFIVIFSLCAFNVAAQHQLSGTVKDAADGAPVPFATAALMRADSTIVTGVMAGDDGKFVLANVAAGDYIVQVSFIGYEKAYRNVNVPAQSDLGEIILTESTTRMQEVVITADRPLVAMKADRYVVNVSGNIQSAGRNSLDILRNTPGLLVSQNGNISVLGNSVQVWIDGRPSRMSGDQLQAFLNSMQGGEIDRIEVITNPSSRYEAEGAGGIIDIRTKKGLQFGVNGTITAGYRQGHADRENAGINLNWRREKFNMFGNYSFNRDNSWENINQINVQQTPAGEITLTNHARGTNVDAAIRNSVRAGMDFFINPGNIFGVIVNAYHSPDAIGNLKGRTDIKPDYNGVSYTTADNYQTRGRDGIQVNTNYQSIFAKAGQQLNLDMDYARFNSYSFQDNSNRYFDTYGMMIGAVEQFSNTNPQTIDVYSAKIDYTQPLWKDARMETGAKFSQTKTDNDLKYAEVIGNVWEEDPGRSNRFVYTEQIGAAYININQRVGKFNFQGGLRGEYTSSKGEQKTTGEVNDTTYFNLFPTFFMNYQPSPKHTFGLSYSRRLSRPSYNVLNPFEVTIDAYSYTRGNPGLTPAYTHNVQLSHTFSQSLMTRIAYTHTVDMIMLTPVDDAATGRTGLIQMNFGKSRQYFAMANYRKQIVKIWTANLTVQGGYLKNTSAEATGEFVNEGMAFMAQLNNNITITPTLSAEITGLYVAGQRMAYFVLKPMGNFSVGLRQTLLKNKMTLSLTVNDLLYTSKERVQAQYENVNWSLNNGLDNRYANLTLRYNFGSATVRAARNKQTGIEDETSRAGGR